MASSFDAIESKIFNDPIHGHMDFDPLLIKVIDTPQFQRLRHIKQLGNCYWVYPSANHNRFEHSLGTCYLASKLVQSLKNGLDNDLEIEITEKDIFLVSLAALCHDLGHGPLSHAFDGIFLEKLELKKKHEDLSVEMLDRLLKENDLIPKFKERFNDFDDEVDIEFVREQIRGPKENDVLIGLKDNKKRFLYDIVSNKESGVDVDKFDYIARDCHHLGIKSTFDHSRYIKLAKIIKSGDSYKICIREKEARNIYELFHMRLVLHDRAYQHKTCKAIELMMMDALYSAKDHIKVITSNKELKLEETVNNAEAFEQLTDNTIFGLRYTTDPNLKECRELLERIDQRKIYRCMYQGDISLKENVDMILEDYKDKIIIAPVNLNYGMKNLNPVDHCWFYEKSNTKECFTIKKEEVSQFLPQKFSEKRIRIYYKGVDKEEYEEIKKKLIEELNKQHTN
ncbi:DgyrCDS6560 [Dimorphilus gyrociliatus]|uniref:DgyrCDS6560 n=1 Tax=Dimorphilus gyrociliatus TaxID=2664684 RepID=A0A7I8VNJ3_9ANNE|nr:DgyrCDS6560 [Dimorphilus gyrociliatus]